MLARGEYTVSPLADGATGAAGRSVTSITEEYYLSTSKTAQAGGSWVTTPPAWSAGKYLWTRSKIVYADPAGTVWTEPVCDSSWEAVNDVQVGGRNLAEKTNQGINGWVFNIAGPATGTREEFIENGIRGVRFKRGDNPIGSWMYLSYVNIGLLKYEPGTIYTISFDVKASLAMTINTVIMLGTATLPIASSTTYSNGNSIGTDWKKFVCVFKTFDPLPAITNQVLYISVGNTGANTEYYFRNLKIEKGNKATDWTPAPEDIDSKIDDVEAGLQESIAGSAESQNERAQQIADLVDDLTAALLELETSTSADNTIVQAGITAINAAIKALEDEADALRDGLGGEQEARQYTDQFIKAGLLYVDEQGVDRYGVAVGENLTVITDESGKIVLKREGLACTMTSDRISFWQLGKEVAYFSSGVLFVNEINTKVLKIGKVYEWEFATNPTGGGIRWGGV